MRKFVTGVLIMGIVSLISGCGAGTTTIDYADYPENFMIQLKADQNYVLKNGENLTDFSAMTHSVVKWKQVLTYGDLKYDLSHAVYYRKTEPVLIHYNDKDYIWICEENSEGKIDGVSFFYLTEYHSFGSDNGTVSLKIGDEILDPSDFVMDKSVNCFGSATTKVHYRINEQGKPEELASDAEFYYIDAPYSEETFYLGDDINTWVYADADSKESTVEVVPQGTCFKRFRIPKNAEYKYVEGILEDGRVIRVIEEYWFSEPTAYQAMMDKDAKQFNYYTNERDNL